MLSRSVKLDSRKRSHKFSETKVLVCGLVVFIVLLALFPIVMLSLVTLQPEMVGVDVYYLFSKVNPHLKQSGLAEEQEKCTEHELFNSWHTLAHMEEKLSQKVNRTHMHNHEVHASEDHPDNHPGLLSVDAVGSVILNTTLHDFRGELKHEVQLQHEEAGPTQPPSTPAGESPELELSSATSSIQSAKKPAAGNTSSDVRELIASLHIDYASHPTLHWTPSTKPHSGAFMKKRSQVPADVSLKEIHGAHWGGHIPKVACILALPATTRAHARLKYVVNNFKSQNYEGAKQLIIVHHYQDHTGAERIRNLADGYVVKAVPARTMEVPSATALRYGAWSADKDTDIIARWDVDGWHHPQRLAMQVRALAFSKRQACLLKRWTVTPGDGSRSVVEDEIGGEHSLIGERAWMDRNWQPLLEESKQALLAHQGQVALLDMAELLVVSPGHEG